ncbi:hypothetical protein BXZ70DRAFT_929645, partial [Cristinia sonorae]
MMSLAILAVTKSFACSYSTTPHSELELGSALQKMFRLFGVLVQCTPPSEGYSHAWMARHGDDLQVGGTCLGPR